MKDKYKLFMGVAITILVIGAIAASVRNSKPQYQPIVFKHGTVKINNQTLNVDVADTAQTQQQGLSSRDSLADNSGMLFVFAAEGRFAFWMKDMKFPLDFIWIHQGRVVEITPNVPTELGLTDTSLHQYLPKEIIDKVLEVNSGWAQKNQIKVGDSVVDQF